MTISNQFNIPSKIMEMSMKGSVEKATMPLGKMILLGIMAGAFIALGGATSNTAVHSIANVGLARTLAGCIFPVGLMMIVFVGGELFTGNCLISMALLDRRIRFGQFIRNLAVVYFSNLLGALLVVVLLYFSGNLDYTDGLLGAYTIKVMMGKVAITPIKGFTSGILCYVLVCIAIFMATAATDIAGKVWAIFFPIMAFVVGGFEHCVANMFYIPAGLLAAQNPEYVQKAVEVYGMSAENIQSLNVGDVLQNMIPVTIGNVIGGVSVGLVCYVIYVKKWTNLQKC